MYSGLAYLSLQSDFNIVLSTWHVIFADNALESLSPQPELLSQGERVSTGRERALSLEKKVCPPGMDEQTEASGDETEVNKPRMRTLNAAAPLHTTSPCSLPPCQEEFHDAMEENDMRQGCGPRLQGSTTESNSEPPEIEVEGAAEAKTEMPASGGSEHGGHFQG
jgi:hypothetical protein